MKHMMRGLGGWAAAMLTAGAVCGCDRVVTMERGKVEVVIAADAPKTVRFAADEMTNFLSRVFAAAVPVRELGNREEEIGNREEAWKGGKVKSIILGDNVWARAEGMDVASLAVDGFAIKVTDRAVFIAGADDPTADIAAIIRSGRIDGATGACIKHCGQHGTLFGVYEFLERIAGCRFYFAHPLGTVVPRRDRLEIPFGNLRCEPKWTMRNIYLAGDGAWPDEKDADCGRRSPKCLSWLRLRLESQSVVACHGFNYFQFSQRFGKSHPEWFYLARDHATGKLFRDPGSGTSMHHMCYSNDAVWDQLLSDVKAHMTGVKPETIGIMREWNSGADGWGPQFRYGFLDIDPQDGLRECLCEKCQAAYEPKRRPLGWASELLWSKRAEFARKAQAMGCPYRILVSAYGGFTGMPRCDLPTNIVVEVSVPGPWSWGAAATLEEEVARVKAWAEKTGNKTRTWTYPAKHPEFMPFPGVPDIAPRAFAGYFRRMAPYSEGSFCETECERSMLHYLNYYVFAKLAWNPDLDLEALLDEHYRLMFGAGAADMRAFFEMCEDKWIREIVGKVKETDLGPQPVLPNRAEMWMRIWGEEAVARAVALVDAAAAKASADRASSARIALMRREILEPLVAARTAAMEGISVPLAQKRRAARTVRNLFRNGSFAEGAKDWALGKGVSLDEKDCVTAPALKFENPTGKTHVNALQKSPGIFKPNTRYRVSFFVKFDNVVAHNPIGHSFWFESYDGEKWHCGPAYDAALLGTADWHHCCWEFKTGDMKNADLSKQYVGFEMSDFVTGMGWIDDPVLEEIAE